MPKVIDRQLAFSTPWFDVVAKQINGQRLPHYTVKPLDYVTVIVTTTEGRVLLVKQYRPVVEAYTLELLGTLVPDTGRLGNRMWYFTASDARPIIPSPPLDDGIELVTYAPDEFVSTLADLGCNHALNFAAVMLAVLKGRFSGFGSR